MIKANKNTTSLVFIQNILSNKKSKEIVVAQKFFREKEIVKKMKFSTPKR